MSRILTRVAAVSAAAIAFSLLPSAPASATVHELVAQWCSGRGELAPPGLTGGSNADNFAKPVDATGVAGPVVPYEDGFLVSFNWDANASKTTGSGIFIVIGEIEGMPLYLELPMPDPNFPAFKHCPRLSGH